MRILRILLGCVLWLVAGVLGLLGLVLSVTVILLPIGIPLLMLARRVFQGAMRLMLPKAAAHPIEELGSKMPDAFSRGRAGRKARKKLGKKAGKSSGKAADTVTGKAGKAGKAVRKKRKKLPV